MAMPPQLARAKRPKRSSPRPLVETLQRLDIGDLCRLKVFPNNHEQYYLQLPFKYPLLKSLVISFEQIEANHVSGYNQLIRLRWIRTGFGGNSSPRPMFICQCGRSVTKLYFNVGNLACVDCHDGVYASQVCARHFRPILQAKRLRSLLDFKTYMSKRNRQRLKARIATSKQQLNSKRLSHHAIQLPQGNYSTRGAMHWM